MLCPNCNSSEVRTLAVVDNPDDKESYNRYQCRECLKTFFSVEFEAVYNEQFEMAYASYFDHKSPRYDI